MDENRDGLEKREGEAQRRAEGDNTYARLEYRRFVSWSERIRREAPLLLETLGQGTAGRVLDLGCGTGEHSRFLASEGFEVVGVDASGASLALARSESADGRLTFVEARIEDLGKHVSGTFNGAISLGNTLVNLRDEAQFTAFLEGLASVLEENARFLFQILNYARLRKTNTRYLPLNFQSDALGNRVFIRLMEYLPDGRVHFYPTMLRFGADRNPVVEVVESACVELRGWEWGDLEPLLSESGFRVEKVLGGFDGSPFVSESSNDLIVVASPGRLTVARPPSAVDGP